MLFSVLIISTIVDEISAVKRKLSELETNVNLEKSKRQDLEAIVDDLKYILPPRFQENAKSSSVIIRNLDKSFSGVGFFVAPDKVISVYHNLKTYGSKIQEKQQIWASIYDINGSLVEVELVVKAVDEAYDIVVFLYNGSHSSFLKIADVPVSGNNRLVVASFTDSLSKQLSEIKTFTDDGFAIIPSHLVKKSSHHIVYLSVAFSGDSGGAVIFSHDGTVIAMHLETVNEANEEFGPSNSLKATLKNVAESVNSIIRGYSSGFLGLRLNTAEIQKLIN